MHAEITPLVLTCNEAPNLRRTLQHLTWASEVLVLDSLSADETLAIAAEFSNVRLLQRPFDSHAAQWNHGVGEAKTLWVLALDADYVLSDELIRELKTWQPPENIAAVFARFRYCIFGKPLRGTLYPPRAVLFRRDRCCYVQDGHTQRLQINGATADFSGLIDHDDRKPFPHWLRSQDRYAQLEVEKLRTAALETLSLQDCIRRRIIFAPALVFVYTLFGKGLIFDGWPGWYYAFQRTLAETILSLRLIEARFHSKT